MAYKLIVSADAHRDIDDITRYIAHEICNLPAAISFLDDVEKSYRFIVENPYMYGLCADKRLQKEGYRKVPIKNYLVIYRVDEEKKRVSVVRVIYGRRDYAKLL